MTFYLFKGLCYSCTKNTWQNFEAITRVYAVSQKSWLQSKVTFPNLPPAQGHASPSRKLVLPQIDHNYTIGDIYVVYICIGCPILSHMVPELINNLICWNCKGCIRKSIGPIQYRFTIPSLRAQRQVAGSFFWQKKNKEKTLWKNWASYMPLSQLGVRHQPGQYIFSTFTFACHFKVT